MDEIIVQVRYDKEAYVKSTEQVREWSLKGR